MQLGVYLKLMNSSKPTIPLKNNLTFIYFLPPGIFYGRSNVSQTLPLLLGSEFLLIFLRTKNVTFL